jgi:hypothetical protein
MANWEYCIVTRLTWGVDTKWYVNRVYKHSETEMPEEVTGAPFVGYNNAFEKLHAKLVYPILPAVLNLLGADGWELLDDMNTGMPGGEGLVFKREVTAKSNRTKTLAKKKTVAKKKTRR